jgi:hypothetical protein
VQKGQLKQAIDTFRKGLTLEGSTELWSGLGYAYASEQDKAQDLLAKLREMSKTIYVAPYNIAVIHSRAGRQECGLRRAGAGLHRTLLSAGRILQYRRATCQPQVRSALRRSATADGVAG